MLSESEQRRLNEIESLLQGEDPSWVRRFARTTDAIAVHRRRVVAVVIAVAAVAAVIVGLVLASVPITVVSICGVGAAAFLWTWRPAGQRNEQKKADKAAPAADSLD
jgi:Flp pilus assembly protein TadB